MSETKQEPISELLSSLANSAVDIQKKWDAQFITDYEIFEKLLTETPAEYRDFLRPLVPARQRMSRYEVDVRIQFKKEKTVEADFQLGVQLLHFSADLRFQRDISKDSQIKICVEQIALGGQGLKEQIKD